MAIIKCICKKMDKITIEIFISDMALELKLFRAWWCKKNPENCQTEMTEDEWMEHFLNVIKKG